MSRCPITYENCGIERYSKTGLIKLSKNLTCLKPFPYSAAEQLQEAASRADKMSIQGVQPKLSARLNIKKCGFDIVDRGGQFILKPQNPGYAQLPENEDLTMRMAEAAGIETPFHGLIYSKDNSLTYFIKRFDRISKNRKLALEDFAQLAGKSRETKYNYSMEGVGKIVERFCTFPALEKIKLFRLTLFNFLTGNEDMHLKNFSLISRQEKIELSPAYDLLNTSIVLKNVEEEIALPLKGKKNKLDIQIFVDYFAVQRLGLSIKIVNNILLDLSKAYTKWDDLIKLSFLSDQMKEKYFDLLEERKGRLGV